MNTPKPPDNLDAEIDENGIPRYQIYRDSSGRSWRKPIPEKVRRELHICVLMDQIEASLEEAFKALALEGVRLINHGGSDDKDVLRLQWQEAASTFGTELERVATPAKRIVAALKELFEI